MPKLALLGPRYWPTWLGYFALRLIGLLPYRGLLIVGRAMGGLLRLLPIAYVRIARRNLELCFPELDAAERERLLRRHFASVGIGVCEMTLCWWASDERIRELSVLEGTAHLERALEAGRGVILIGGHFTTIEVATRLLGQTRAPVSPLYRPPSNAALAAILHHERSRWAVQAIPHDAIRKVVAELRRNGVVWYPPDQAYRKKGAAMVPFFGIPAATTTATSRLAALTGASVLPYFVERLESGGYRGVIGPAFEGFPSGDPVADVERYNRLLEAHIRRVPEQYLWMHRRFKGLYAGYPDYYGRDTRPRAPFAEPPS
jgi:KDO2-lipid IV(A) lauroyltransferase